MDQTAADLEILAHLVPRQRSRRRAGAPAFAPVRPARPVEPARAPAGPAEAAGWVEPHLVLAERLAETWRRGGAASVTWLNHVSAHTALASNAEAVGRMDFVGVDGVLLKRLVRERHRTSADLVVPELLARTPGARVLLIGGTPGSCAAAARSVGERFPLVQVVGALDGYAGLHRGARLMDTLHRTRADVVLIGLGAGLQEEVADEVKSYLGRGLSMTVGGFLDQVQQAAYYPAWAYPLRLNWAVRLAREPRRLWRRYTLDAARAVGERGYLRSQVTGLAGYTSMCATLAA